MHSTATPYERHRAYVLAVLGRRCAWLDPGDQEAVLHDAYALLLQKERAGDLNTADMAEGQLRAYLTQTALNKALDEGKRAERKRCLPFGDEAPTIPDPSYSPEETVDMAIESGRVREILAELDPRARAIVNLRFFVGLSPEEIQRHLNITRRVYRRDLERSLKYMARRYELVREGRWCEERRSVVLAYVAGVAGPKRANEARGHLANCPGCTRMVVTLRETTQRAAA